MPYKSEFIKIAGTKYDRRIKLSDSDKEEIKRKYKPHVYSYQRLADEYSVSKRLIIFIVKPELHKKNIKNRKERGGSMQYYDKNERRETMRDYRRYKEKLAKKGLIK